MGPNLGGLSENYVQFETKRVVRLSHENRFSFPPWSPKPSRTSDETSSETKYPPPPCWAFHAPYKVGIKFAIVCLEAKRTLLAGAPWILWLVPSLSLAPAVVGCRLPKLMVSNGSRRLNTPITSWCQGVSKAWGGGRGRVRKRERGAGRHQEDISKHGRQSA